MTSKKPRRVSTPIINAVLAGDRVGLVSAIAAGGDINERDADGRTALHHAAIQEDVSMVMTLLDTNALATVRDRDGWTPLHFAAQSHRVDIGRLLVARGAEVDAADSHGNTPLFRAVFESRGRGEMITFLLASGADKNRTNNHGVSPAELAGTIANYEVKKWLN